jgi:hypothetical protein
MTLRSTRLRSFAAGAVSFVATALAILCHHATLTPHPFA